MGTEDWVFKGTKLITNTKKQRLKIQSRGWIFINIILKKRKEGEITKIIIYMKVALKNRVSFFVAKYYQVIKMKTKGVIEDLKFFKKLKKGKGKKQKKEREEKKKKKKKKEKNDRKNKSRTFSGVVVGSVGSVHFQIVSWSSLYFSRSIGPFLCSRY